MDENTPGSAPDQQAPAPDQQANQQAAHVPLERYKGTVQALNEKNQMLKSLQTELEDARVTAAQYQKEAQERASKIEELSQLRAELEEGHKTLQTQLERMKLFSEFPELAPFADAIELKGDPEEQKATLQKLAEKIQGEAKQLAEQEVEKQLSNVTEQPRPMSEMDPAEEAAMLEDRWMEAIRNNKVEEVPALRDAYFDALARASGENDPWSPDNIYRRM